MTADEIKAILGLTPHPREGGWYVRTYEAGEMIPPSSFGDGRYDSARRTGTAIYYLLEPETFSEMHVLSSDEVFHFYAGDPVEQLQLFADGSGRLVTIGPDLAAGERPQVVVSHGGVARRSTEGWRKLVPAGLHRQPGLRVSGLSVGNAGRALRPLAALVSRD